MFYVLPVLSTSTRYLNFKNSAGSDVVNGFDYIPVLIMFIVFPLTAVLLWSGILRPEPVRVNAGIEPAQVECHSAPFEGCVVGAVLSWKASTTACCTGARADSVLALPSSRQGRRSQIRPLSLTRSRLSINTLSGNRPASLSICARPPMKRPNPVTLAWRRPTCA